MYQVFVSYVYEDLRYRQKVEAWADAGRLGPNTTVTGEASDVRQGGSSAIKGHISPKLQGASALLVLVGNDTHNHAWVDYEVNYMLSAGKPVVVARIPNTSGAAPAWVRRSGVVAFEPDAIRRALDR